MPTLQEQDIEFEKPTTGQTLSAGDIEFDTPQEAVIRQAPPEQSEGILLGDSLKRILDFTKESPETSRAKAMNSLAISENLRENGQDVSPSTVYRNFDAFSKEMGLRGTPTTGELIGGVMTLSSPFLAGKFGFLKTLVGVTGFQALTEAESAAVNYVKGEKYQVFQNKGISELLPEDTNTLTRDFVEIVAMMAKGMAVAKITPPSLRMKLIKEVVDEHALPGTIYVNPSEVNRATKEGVVPASEEQIYRDLGVTPDQVSQAKSNGDHIEVPSENLINVTDKQWYGKIKDILKIDPSQKLPTREGGKPLPEQADLVAKLKQSVEEQGGAYLGEHEGKAIVSDANGKISAIEPDATPKAIRETVNPPKPEVSEEQINAALDEMIASKSEVNDAAIDSLFRNIEKPVGTRIEKTAAGDQVKLTGEGFDARMPTSSIKAEEPKEFFKSIEPEPEQQSLLSDKPRKFNPEEDSLADFVRKEGGISSKQETSMGGEIQRFTIKEGHNLINNKSGKPLDTLLESAKQHHFRGVDRDTSVSDFTELLREDIDARGGTGQRVWSMRKQDYFFNDRGAIDIPKLTETGKRIWSDGYESLKDFSARLKEIVGDAWGKIKDVVGKVWQMVKDYNERLGESGAIRFGRQDREKLEEVGLTNEEIARMEKVAESDDVELKSAFTKLANAAKKAFEAGKSEELVTLKNKMREIIYKRRTLAEVIKRKELRKAENLRRAMGLPPVSQMTREQLNDFVSVLEQYQHGDTFLGQRELETVDKTDLAGIRTWREAKQKLSKETGVPIKELESIKVSEFDDYRWDTALRERNPFYKLMVEETTRSLMAGDLKVHNIESDAFKLAEASNKSRSRSIGEKLIPKDKQIMDYLEAPTQDIRSRLESEMTQQQIDYAHYIRDYFAAARDYLIQTKALQKGRENYYVHMRKTFLENVRDGGLKKAFKAVFKAYEQDEMVFNILDEDTGNILPLEKFFQYTLRRTGALEPTENVTRAFNTYVKTFEKKKALDAIIPKIEIYAQSLTPEIYTPRGLEVDRSLKTFVNKYLNNKKGRQIRVLFKQGGKADIAVKNLRSFTAMIDLGLNVPLGIANYFAGDKIVNFISLGTKSYALGSKRMLTPQGKEIIKKYESFTGRSLWEQFKAPGRQITERLNEGLFGLFHLSVVNANKRYLLGSLSKHEFESGAISDSRLAEIRLEMGRWRHIPGGRSLVGSTGAGDAAMQYKTWAAPILRTTTKDIGTLYRDISNKPLGEALTTREAKELYRIIGISATVFMVLNAAGENEKRDDSFAGQLERQVRNQSQSLTQGIDPALWLSTPRILVFLAQLGKNLHSLITLEEYKTKPGLKGVGGLQQQITPAPLRGIAQERQGQNTVSR